MNQNQYRNLIVEFHILQSFPVTCLNRDDVGAPKTAMIGGTTRSRVSSQCWKRYVRLAMREFGAKLGTRTKFIADLIMEACKANGATEEQSESCGQAVASVFISAKKKPKSEKEKTEPVESEDENTTGNDKSDSLIFISKAEIEKIVIALKANDFKTTFEITKVDKKSGKEKIEKVDIEKKILDLIGKPNSVLDALDIALFGRMVAQAATLNVEAASSFAHAISTHKVTNEVEFFTALDDNPKDLGSSHMGSLEFNSATYYRYISLNVGQLWQTLGGHNIPEAIETFVKALFVAVPGARQATQSGASPWEFARVLVRKGQRLQVPFETAVKAQHGGFLEPSKKEMREYLAKKEKLAGSLFGKIQSFDFGENEEFNIDNLISSINAAITNFKDKA